MKPIVYNKYINRIGIEFEGFFKPSLTFSYPEVPKGLFAEHGGDGSLRSDNYSNNLDLVAHELRTYPLTADQLTDALGILDIRQNSGEYYLNSSCGLHFHVSLTQQELYLNLVEEGFYNAFAKMFKQAFPRVYEERSTAYYSMERYVSEDLNSNMLRELRDRRNKINSKFSLSGGNKYAFIHYQIANRGTIEFRAYGGKRATVEELAICIQNTINLIQEYIDNPQVISEEVYFDEKGKFIRPKDSLLAFALLDDRQVPKTETIHLLRPIKLVNNRQSQDSFPF